MALRCVSVQFKSRRRLVANISITSVDSRKNVWTFHSNLGKQFRSLIGKFIFLLQPLINGKRNIKIK